MLSVEDRSCGCAEYTAIYTKTPRFTIPFLSTVFSVERRRYRAERRILYAGAHNINSACLVVARRLPHKVTCHTGTVISWGVAILLVPNASFSQGDDLGAQRLTEGRVGDPPSF